MGVARIFSRVEGVNVCERSESASQLMTKLVAPLTVLPPMTPPGYAHESLIKFQLCYKVLHPPISKFMFTKINYHLDELQLVRRVEKFGFISFYSRFSS